MAYDQISIENASNLLSDTFSSAMKLATTTKIISAKPGHTSEIPAFILILIKEKRKLRRSLCRFNSPSTRTLFNCLNRKIKVALKNFKRENLAKKFTELKSFNQSCSKHWQLLKKIEKGTNESTKNQSFKVNNGMLNDDQDIAESFALNLANIFSKPSAIHFLPKITSSDSTSC